ncbi:MAG: hypothetical protein AAF471_02105, partial [Myxococcota bacterium]
MMKTWVTRYAGWVLAAMSVAVCSCSKGEEAEADGLIFGTSLFADHRVISNNYAGIQNNAFEFEKIFDGYTVGYNNYKRSHDKVLSAVKKYLEDMDFNSAITSNDIFQFY